MSEEEINKMCSDIYEGEDWQRMKDYIKSLQTQLQQKENIMKEVRELIKTGASYCENGCVDDLSINDCNKILEILDKGSDKE